MLILGKGLLGSAAAKHLSAAGLQVTVMGPDEPADYQQATVFASHYDQARVQRRIGKDRVWTKLNTDAAAQYPTMAAQSGIDFHGAVGCLYVNPYGQDDYLKNAATLGAQFGLPFDTFHNNRDLAAAFGDFQFPEAAQGLFEAAPAGFVNPRKLIEAQLALTQQNGGRVLKETALKVDFSGNTFQVHTREGHVYEASQILVAAGSFVNYLPLLPQKLALKCKSEVVLLAKVSAAQARKMTRLPSLLYEIDDHDTEGIYLIQPVQYPDGHFYLKMGCNMPEDQYFDRLEEAQEWFRHGDSDRFLERQKAALMQLMPGVPFEGFLTKRCLISRTPHGRPYIGETAQPGLFVAGGCNGYSAMCSDAIGGVAAHLMREGGLPSGYEAGDFELIFA